MVDRQLVRRNDSFDIGRQSIQPIEQSVEQQDILVNLLQNPQELMGALSLTEEQARNVSALISGAGAGAAYKYLSKHIGGELAAALGGFLGAVIARKIQGK